MKTWFEMKAAASGDKQSEVMIFGEIGGWGVGAADFARQLASIPEDHSITVRINSPGGSITEGYAIFNALKRRANVTTIVEGLAASMASVVMLAGSKIQANANSLLVIHNPLLMGATGNAEELRKAAADLDKIAGQIVGIYASATGKTDAEVRAAMDAETMFTAEEAKAWGLVHDVLADVTDSSGVAAQNSIVPILTKMRAQVAAGAAAAVELEAIRAELATAKQHAENAAAQIESLKVESDQRAAAIDAEKAAHAITAAQRDDARAELKRRDAEAAVDSAISAGRLAVTARAEFVALFVADAEKAQAILSALPAARGNPPVPPETKSEASTDAAIYAEYRALKGKARDDFFAKHKDAIWRAAGSQ